MDDATASRPAGTWHELCLFLGGSPSSFTGQLLELVAKADPGDRERLREAFPRQVAALEALREIGPCTWGELETAITVRERRRTVTFDLSDSARRHALIAALDRYADRQQAAAAAGIDPDRRLTLAAHAKDMRQRAAAAAVEDGSR
jgi:hypothetical protein